MPFDTPISIIKTDHEVTESLIQGYNKIITYGWCQGVGHSDDGKVCALTALDIMGSANWGQAGDALYNALPEHAKGPQACVRHVKTIKLMDYNDHPSTTKEDILTLYLCAIVNSRRFHYIGRDVIP